MGVLGGTVFINSPLLGFCYGLTIGLICACANALFGNKGFYGSAGLIAISLIAYEKSTCQTNQKIRNAFKKILNDAHG